MVKIVYFPAERHEMKQSRNNETSYKPIVHWGVEVYRKDSTVMYQVYELRQFSEVDGTPYAEFTESNKYKIPKSKLTCDLSVSDYMTYNEFNRLKDDIAKIDYRKPETLTDAIDKGYLIPHSQGATHISVEIEKPYFYLKKVSNGGICNIGATDDTFTISADKCYDTYDEALTQAKALIAGYIESDRLNLEIDFRLDCDYQLSRLPEADKEPAEKIVRLLPHFKGFSLRYFNHQLLYRSNSHEPFQVIYTDSEYSAD